MPGGTTTSPILITGGTGTLGRLVVRRLRDAGCAVRVLTCQGHEAEGGVEFVTGDLSTGEGIEAAVDGVTSIVHCAGSNTGDADLTRTLVRAASSQPWLPHVVYISVVGAKRIPVESRLDRAMFGYFESKRETERVVADSGLPWTTLRATQFHDLILTVVRQLAKLPIVPLPAGFRVQPVEADEVAARRAHAHRACWAGTRHGWSAGVRRGRPAPRVPSGHSAASADRAGLAAGQGRPRVPGRR
jgi:uncharacterized protein YbjT (DUF2867 family)